MKNLILKIYHKALFYFSFLFLIPFFFNFILFKVNKIKFFKLRRDTVGNSVLELYLYLNIFKKNKNHFFFFDDQFVCNSYFDKICKKNLKFKFLGISLHFLFKKFNIFKSLFIEMPNWGSLYNYNYQLKKIKTPKEFKFSNKQNLKGKNFLKKIGAGDNKKIVCLVLRDNFYKSNYSNELNKNWNYHSYRNVKINTYLKTIKYLNSNGYFVIRMGKGAERKLKYNNHLYYDYATSNLRTDFLDFWIMSKAFFCITSGTGIDELCAVYKVPTVDTNFLPIGAIRTLQNKNITIFKKSKNKINNKYLNFSEIIKNELFVRPQLFYEKKNKFFWEDNTSQEILDATKEMELLLLRKTNNKKLKNINQKKFWKIFFSVKKYSNIYRENEINNLKFQYKYRNIYNSFVSEKFISKNKWLLR